MEVFDGYLFNSVISMSEATSVNPNGLYKFVHKNNSMHKKAIIASANSAPSSLPLTERAFALLRQDVIAGDFEPGAKLKLDELQARYGFSSSPLREALSRLAQEGLVKADERKGFRVTAISAEDLRDITRMRLLIDVQALEDSIANGDDSWEADIVSANHRLDKVESRLSDGPVVLNEEWSRLHKDFHMSLVAACTSRRQLVWSDSLFDQAERYRRFSARHRTTSRRKADEHRQLMDAVVARNSKLACAMLTEHIQSTLRNVESALQVLDRKALGT